MITRAKASTSRAKRDVHVRALALVEWSSPVATLDVVCSKGTYIRALAADLGLALGCGAHLAGLRRTATGGFVVDEAITLDGLAQMQPPERDARLCPVDCLLAGLPRLDLADDDAIRLRHGRSIEAPARTFDRFRAYGPDGGLVGVLARVDNVLVPDRLMRYAS